MDVPEGSGAGESADVGRSAAEGATGCAQTGALGRLYGAGGAELPDVEARERIRRGEPVHVPNAGAGSYQEFFRRMGASDVRALDRTSSAGDWEFAVLFDGDDAWFPAFQGNRYPHHGFVYSVDTSFGMAAEVMEV